MKSVKVPALELFLHEMISLATLAGYGVVWELMKDEKKTDKPVWHIVVKESRAAYRRPVIGDLRAICERPAQAAIAEFKEALARYGKAKLKLRASIIEDGNVAVDVQAAFVVSR